jgi:hypothetical protein
MILFRAFREAINDLRERLTSVAVRVEQLEALFVVVRGELGIKLPDGRVAFLTPNRMGKVIYGRDEANLDAKSNGGR